MKKNLDKIVNFVTSIGIYIAATVIFPKIDNQDLIQSKINVDKLTALTLLVLYLAFVGFSAQWKSIKARIYTIVGSLLMFGFFYILFAFYYPYVNRKIIDVKFECGHIYLKGDSVNYSKLHQINAMNFDSLSKNDPKAFIQRMDCDPSVCWTFESIEHNYNVIILRYVLSITLFSIGIFSLLKAVTKSFS
jgi:hypothetical protein